MDGIKSMKPAYKVSVGSIYVCFATDIDKGTYEPTVYKFDVVKKIGVSENGSSTPIYSSGKKYDNVNSTAGTQLSIDNIAFPDEIIARMRGDSIGSEYGGVLSGASNERPYFMCGYTELKSWSVKKFRQFPKCQLTENTNDIETKEDAYKEQNDTLTIASSAFDDAGNDSYSIQTDNEKYPEKLTEELFFSKVIKSDADIKAILPDELKVRND